MQKYLEKVSEPLCLYSNKYKIWWTNTLIFVHHIFTAFYSTFSRQKIKQDETKKNTGQSVDSLCPVLLIKRGLLTLLAVRAIPNNLADTLDLRLAEGSR